MRQWADRECVDNCSNADGPSQQPPDRQDAYLYRGPHQPNGMTSRRQTGHQAVARPRSEPRSDVETGSHPVEHDTADKTNDLPRRRVRVREQSQGDVYSDPHEDCVAHGSQAGTLLEGDPQHKDEDSDPNRAQTDRDVRAFAQSLVKNVPGVEAQSREDQQCRAKPEQRQPQIKLEETAKEMERGTGSKIDMARQDKCEATANGPLKLHSASAFKKSSAKTFAYP